MSGFTTLLLTGLATDLNTGSVGTYKASGVYTIAETAIVAGTIPQAPDRIIALDTYPVSDHPSLSDSIVGVQVRTRWAGLDPTKVKDLDDLIFMRWHGMTNVTLTGGVFVVQCLSQSGSSLGQDANNRWEYSHNYYLTLWRPSTNRT